MQLRHLFAGLVSLAVGLGLVALAALAFMATRVDRLAVEQRRAQLIAREVSSVLALTQEYVLHSEERAEQQWRKRYAALGEALAREASASADQLQAAPDLRDQTKALPELFDALVQLSLQSQDALKARRRELLVDRLLSETQTIAEDAYQWEARVATSRATVERRLLFMAIALPALLALLFAGSAWLLARRMLKPIAILQRATAMAAAGDFTVRCESHAHDEVGDLARAFDYMVHELQASIGAIKSAEAFLRNITDNLPVRIAYVDREMKYRFVNKSHCQRLGRGRAEIIGHTREELTGQATDPEVLAHVSAALNGQTSKFEFTEEIGGKLLCIESSLVPDIAANGTVKGLFSTGVDVTERRNQQARIEQALREKETLLKEVHHRVKNNMQVISSLLHLQAGYIDSAEAKEVFDESQARIKSMALVHEKLYQTENFADVDFADYVHSLVSMLTSTATTRAAVDIVVQPLWLGIERAVPAALILNELVSNSFKHAFPDGRAGRVVVEVEARDDQVTLAVRDNGVGPPANLAPSSSPTLGLRLVYILSEQLGATMSIRHDNGFTCELVFDRQDQSHKEERMPITGDATTG